MPDETFPKSIGFISRFFHTGCHIPGRPYRFLAAVEPLSRSCGLPTGPRMTLDTRHCPLVSCNAPRGFMKGFFQSGAERKKLLRCRSLYVYFQVRWNSCACRITSNLFSAAAAARLAFSASICLLLSSALMKGSDFHFLLLPQQKRCW